MHFEDPVSNAQVYHFSMYDTHQLQYVQNVNTSVVNKHTIKNNEEEQLKY